jgi:hypothetical protein
VAFGLKDFQKLRRGSWKYHVCNISNFNPLHALVRHLFRLTSKVADSFVNVLFMRQDSVSFYKNAILFLNFQHYNMRHKMFQFLFHNESFFFFISLTLQPER